MSERGRKSAASMTIAPHAGTDSRLSPPANLTAAQKAVWLSMINARPADWFGPEHAGMLEQYCRHKVQADLVAQQLQSFDPAWLADDDGLQRFDKLSAMQDRESKTITALMRSMRLTQQSMIRADKVVRNTIGRKPWQVDD